MRQSEADAMELLEGASPLDGATSWWTSHDEDLLLADVLAQAEDELEDTRAGSLVGRRARTLRVGVLAAVCAAAAGAALVAVDLVGSGRQAAYAEWTASTTTPPASQLAAADSSCRKTYAAMIHPPPSGPGLPVTLPPLVLTDSRGPYEFLVYSGDNGDGTCLWGSSGILSVGGSNGETLPAPNPTSIGIPGVGGGRGSPSLTTAYGHAGTDVTGVTLHLTDGTDVEATVHGGLYAAWWPGSIDVLSTTVTTASGAVTHESFGDVGPNNPTNPGGLQGQ